MGSQQAKPQHSQIFRVEDWEPIQWQPFTSIKDPTFSSNFTVYAHKSNPNMQVEKYQLFFNSQAEYISYLETYYERKKYPSLVNSVHIEQTTKKSMCSTFHSASVYLQRIHFRLCQLIQIPVEQALYMIDCALEGYQKMFQKTGYFQVSSDMIGVNKQGKVKVWVNKNFSKNFPEFNKIDHNKTEGDFIMHILKVIQCCVDYPKGKQKFSQFILKKKTLPTFEAARNDIKQYLRINKLPGQKMMKSILLWIKKSASRPVYSTSQLTNQFKTSSFNASQLGEYQKSPQIDYKNSAQNKNTQSQTNPNPMARKTDFNPNKLKTRRSNNRVFQHNRLYQTFAQEQNPSASQSLINTNGTINLNIFNANPVYTHMISHPLGYQNGKEISLVPGRQKQREYVYDNEKLGSGAIHMSFIKNEKKMDELDEGLGENNLRNSNKTSSKLPSVSFSYNYKSSGLYSPQNLEARQNQWFSSKKTSQTALKDKRNDCRKSLNINVSQQLDQKMKVYYSSGDSHQIDPDIAKDLYSMTTVIK